MPRQWYSKFSTVLLAHGFRQSASDHSLFSLSRGDSFIALLIYVDDIVIASNNNATIHDLKVFLSSEFKLKDLGTLKYFLGLEVARRSKGISIWQCNYALDYSLKLGTLVASHDPHPWATTLSCQRAQEHYLKILPFLDVYLADCYT